MDFPFEIYVNDLGEPVVHHLEDYSPPPDGFIASGGAGLYLRFSTIRLSPSYLGPSGTLLSIVVWSYGFLKFFFAFLNAFA